MSKKLVINTDGGARGNPGDAGIGVIIKSENGEMVYQYGEYIGKATNNVAEYKALIKIIAGVTSFRRHRFAHTNGFRTDCEANARNL